MHDLEKSLSAMLRPYSDRLAALGVGADVLALAKIAIGVLGGAFVAVAPEAALPVVVLALILLVGVMLEGLIVGLDVEKSQQPGTVLLLEIAETTFLLAVLLPLLLVPGFSPLLLALLIIMTVVAEAAGMAGTAIGADRRRDGPLAFALRGVLLAILVFLNGLGVVPEIAINLALAGLVGLGFLTILNRVNAAIEQHAKRSK